MAGWSEEQSESSGSSSGSSQSTSAPIAVQSPQTEWGLQQSQLLSALADRTYNWAMQQYAKGEGVTDQTIANFMEMSGKGKGLADTLLHQYQDQIKPLMDQYIREAGTYASEGRQRFEAGKAMSTVAQADEAAMKSAMDKIVGYGGNVNAGKTQDMLISSRIADAAARAGAGTKAAQDTEATGRQMLENSIKMGQQIPGQAMGAIQSAYAGLTGAESAILGLMNAGKNLSEAAAPYHQAAAAANKLPPVGQNTQSSSQQQSKQQSQSNKQSEQTDPPQKGGQGGQPKGEPKEGGDKGKGGGGGGQGPGDGGGGKAMVDTSKYGRVSYPQSTEKKEEDDGTGTAQEPWETGPTYIDPNTGILTPEYSPGFGRDQEGNFLTPDTPGIWDNPAPFGEWGVPDPNQIFNVPQDQGTTDAIGGGLHGSGTWAGTPGEAQPWEEPYTPAGGNTNPGFDDDAGIMGNIDPFGGQNFAQYEGADEVAQQQDAWGGQDFSNYGDDTGTDWTDAGDDGYQYDDSGYQYDAGDDTSDFTDAGDDGYQYDDSGYQYDAGDDTSDWTDAGDDGTDYNSYDQGIYYDDSGYDDSGYDDSGYDDSGYEGGYEEFAHGGQVNTRPQRPMGNGVMPTTGGAVPKSASPSQGRQTDDISARLNAGEYVIPRDVVKHQGTKFFTDLIAKSRKLRTGMTGAKPGPTMRPALPVGRPTFRSRPLPPR